MVSPSTKKKIIEEALKGVDFKTIFFFYKKMGLEYPNFKPNIELSEKIIYDDLKNILYKVINEIKWETQIDHWLIYYNPHSIEDTALHIQIYFAPFISNTYHFKEEINYKEKLEVNLNEAVEKEEYFLASKIKKELERILSK